MAEACEKMSYLLNPARLILAPCVRHTATLEPGAVWRYSNIFGQADESVQGEKRGKRRKNNLRWRWNNPSCSTELPIADCTPWHTENTIGLHGVSRMNKQNLSLC